MAESKFSAVDAALGYAYQIRCALFYALRHARNDDDFQVGIETLDDVAFTGSTGDPIELLQTKHRIKSKSSLSDAGTDLWKTIRIWAENYGTGVLSPAVKLYLISTATAAPDSVAAMLRSGSDRNIEAAAVKLAVVANTSKNAENKAGYTAYLALSPARRVSLLSMVCVLDAAPTILDLDDELKREVRWCAEKNHVEAFLERLEGWWFRRVLSQLTEVDLSIDSSEIEIKMNDLREQFQRESLPIDDDLFEIEINETLTESYKDRHFVRQVELVTSNVTRVGYAIRDYFRAFEQRSRWIRRELVIDMELRKYERRLEEAWQTAFEQTRDALGGAATDEAMAIAGMALLTWAENASLPIRPKVSEPFVSRGTFHMLADENRVGWHPKFHERLAAILKKTEGKS